jgi:hypothetical protein
VISNWRIPGIGWLWKMCPKGCTCNFATPKMFVISRNLLAVLSTCFRVYPCQGCTRIGLCHPTRERLSLCKGMSVTVRGNTYLSLYEGRATEPDHAMGGQGPLRMTAIYRNAPTLRPSICPRGTCPRTVTCRGPVSKLRRFSVACTTQTPISRRAFPAAPW